jgi:hypothetical protein
MVTESGTADPIWPATVRLRDSGGTLYAAT